MGDSLFADCSTARDDVFPRTPATPFTWMICRQPALGCSARIRSRRDGGAAPTKIYRKNPKMSRRNHDGWQRLIENARERRLFHVRLHWYYVPQLCGICWM